MASDFAIEYPTTLLEALEALSAEDTAVRPIAGGTGLVPLMRYGFFQPTCLVSLRGLGHELSAISAGPDGSLTVGALVTIRELERTPAVTERARMLPQALSRLSNVRIRNVATLGGSLAHGHPQMDLPPVLIALGAEVRVRDRSGERRIAVEDLFRGYYETALEPGELITAVTLPPSAGMRTTYRKVTARTYEDWPMVGLAVRVGIRDGTAHGVRIAAGAVSDRAQRLPAAERLLEGAAVRPRTLDDVAEAGAGELAYRDDQHASGEYRKELVRVSLRRALEDVAASGINE